MSPPVPAPLGHSQHPGPSQWCLPPLSMTSRNPMSCHHPFHSQIGRAERWSRTLRASRGDIPKSTRRSRTMNGRPCCQLLLRNCQRPAADDEGLRAPTPDCLRSSVPPLSRCRTHDAKGTSEGAKVPARCTTRTEEDCPRLGLLRLHARSSECPLWTVVNGVSAVVDICEGRGGG